MKKYILILFFFTGFLQAQTLQNPTFGNTTTNTLKIKTPATVTSVNFLSTNEADGSISKISPINVNIPYTPSNYTISNQSIGQHLTGIDTRLGQISSTTAGITQRVYFTADNTTVTAGTFFTSSLTGKGSTATGSPPALVLADNTKGYFTKDVISVAFPSATIGYAGSYTGQLTVSATPTPVATQQRFTVEIYRTNNGGTPIASGVSGAPTGDLGVTVVAILDSGILNLTAGSITNIPVTGILTQNITLNTGERLRYHVSAAKIGAGGGNVTFGVYYGSSYNSYYDVPVAITTDAVLNKSAVLGITTTDALNTLNNMGSAIYCWGDSMTFGTGSTSGNDYPSILYKSVNWKTINNGVPGETSTQIKDRFVSFYTSNPNELKKPVIIWAGRNNYPSGTTIKADIATMIAMLPHKNYLVLGVTNSNPGEPIGNSGYDQIVALNNDLKILYGGRFLDVRAWLVANYNPSLPQDVIDHGLDLPPTSLLSDNIHLNDKGYRLVSDLVCKSFPYLSNESDISFESVNTRNLYLPNTVNSILKTNVNGQVTNAAIYQNDFNLGLGFSPTSTSDTQNFEFVNGGSIMNRVAVPQMAFSSNAYGTWYAAKYKISNYSTQILLNSNDGNIIFNTAVSGTANANITYSTRMLLSNSGNLGINQVVPTEKLDVVGNGKFSGTVEVATPTVSTHAANKGYVDALVRPYKVYTALLTQSGTSAPTATVLENTLGGTVVWTRSGVGSYVATLTGAFVLNKTSFSATVNGTPIPPSTSSVNIYGNRATADTIAVSTVTNTGFADGAISPAYIEIRVYF